MERAHCDAQGLACEVYETVGDRAIRDGWMNELAGVAKNFGVLYLERRVEQPAMTDLYMLGAQPLEAGYHVYQIHPRTDDEVRLAMQCQAQARQDAIAAYNAAHGTDYTDEDINSGMGDQYAAIETEVSTTEHLNEVARDCASVSRRLTRIEDPESFWMRVEIGTDLANSLGE